MGQNLLIALCLWSCILIVNCKFSGEAVKDVTDYIIKEVLNSIWENKIPQVAYIVKLTKEECSIRTNKNNPDLITGIPNDFFNAINIEKKQNVDKMKDTMNNVIYSGNRILMATPKELKIPVKNGEPIIYTEHAEYRLLTPEGKQTLSPVQVFMNKEPKAHCVIFYSLISPCVDKCINQNNYYNILKSLQNNFQQFTDRAFVYKLVYTPDQVRLNDIKERQEVINAWGGLNNVMTLFRCTGKTCQQCFENGKINESCLK